MTPWATESDSCGLSIRLVEIEEVERSFDVNLGSADGLDLTALAEEVANEVTEQASREDSKVWKALRKKK